MNHNPNQGGPMFIPKPVVAIFGMVVLTVAAVAFMNPESAQAADCTAANIRWAGSSNNLYISGDVSCTPSQIQAIRPSGPLTLVDPANKIWHLRSNLILQNGAKLVIHGSEVGGDTEQLRLQSNNSGINPNVFIRAHWGSIDIQHTKITSWNDGSQSPDTNVTNGRAFIHVRSMLDPDGVTPRESRMDINASDIGYLGYYAAESYGLTWKVSGTTAGIFDKVNVYGNVENSRIHHNYFGFYSYGAYGMNIRFNEFDNNIKYGIDPHDDSDNLLIEGNHSHHNGNHGIICSQRCDNLTIVRNETNNNVGHGIMLHRNANDSLVESNYSHHNTDTGIVLFESHRNIIRNNISTDNKTAIRFSVGSSDNTVSGNEFGRSSYYGVYFYKGSDAPTSGSGRPSNNTFTGNKIFNNKKYAIYLKQADNNVFNDNILTNNTADFYLQDSKNNTWNGTVLKSK